MRSSRNRLRNPPRAAHQVTIEAAPEVVWEALTNPAQMKQWMGPPGMVIEVVTDWQVGKPITVRGFHHMEFENQGKVLRFEPPSALAYSHLSSLSRLEDTPENHSVLEFNLVAAGGGTALTVTLSGFSTEATYRHLDFYWRGTLLVLKDSVEHGSGSYR
jgi:uncharacterized protein YndB with AHSA1/START domain